MDNTPTKVPVVSVQHDGPTLHISVDLQESSQGPFVALRDKTGKFRSFYRIRADIADSAVRVAEGNYSEAAKLLGISRQSLARWRLK